MAEVNARKRGNKWQYYFEGARVDGKRQRICKSGFDTKKEALAAGNQALAEYNSGGVKAIDTNISVKDFADKYLEECKNMLKYSTYISYECALNAYFIKEYGRHKINTINVKTAEVLVLSMKNNGLSSSTIRKNINIIKQMFKYAIKHDVVNNNPFEDVQLPHDLDNAGNPNYSYTDDEIEEFYTVYKNDILGTILMLGYHCGLRLSESLALTWDDIDFDNKSITIDKQMIKRSGIFYFTSPKYDSKRTIGIDNKLILYLKNLKAEKELYPCSKKYRVNLDRSISRIANDDGVTFVVSRIDGTVVSSKYIHGRLDYYKHDGYPTFRTHCLRHTHCTKLLENDVDAKYVQQRLGHKNINTTLNIYYSLTKNKNITESDKVNDIFDTL